MHQFSNSLFPVHSHHHNTYKMEIDSVVRLAQQTAKAARGLASHDIKFYSSIDDKVADSVKENASQLIGVVNQLAQKIAPNEVGSFPPELDTVNRHWNEFSSVVDDLYEKTDIQLGKLNKKGDKVEIAESKKTGPQTLGEKIRVGNAIQSSSEIKGPQWKPQEMWEVDNSRDTPFKPKLTSKPNALEPLEDAFELVTEDDRRDHYPQPYAKEIMEQPYPDEVYEETEVIPNRPWEAEGEDEYIYVDTEEKLRDMVDHLKTQEEIAIDVEHHSMRTYYGITCLVQVSSREQDYIIDTIALRNLEIFNEVLTDPKIVKVLHGATMDIQWLQRDFGLYIVSLFDTFHAAQALGLKGHSLAFLLQHYANFVTSKKYQLSDWRIRPMSPEQLLYARADTHFLLNIYDQLKNALVQKDKIEGVLEKSRQTASQRYEYTGYDPRYYLKSFDYEGGINRLISQFHITGPSVSVAKALFLWRDSMARKEDESTGYVMPNYLLVSLANRMPQTPEAVFSVSKSLPLLVRKNVEEILDVIKESKDEHVEVEQVEEEPVLAAESIEGAEFSEIAEVIFLAAQDGQSDITGKFDSSKSSIVHVKETALGPLGVSKIDKHMMVLAVPVAPLSVDSTESDSEVQNAEEEVKVEQDAAADNESDYSEDEHEHANDIIIAKSNKKYTADKEAKKGVAKEKSEEFTPFDYSAGASILKSDDQKAAEKKAAMTARKQKAKEKKQFNPYEIKEDAKGASKRRGPKDGGARSVQYKKRRT
jgi:exosome complex exonuclease RRP6